MSLNNLNRIIKDTVEVYIVKTTSLDVNAYGLANQIKAFAAGKHTDKLEFRLKDFDVVLEQSHNETNIRIEGEFAGCFTTGNQVVKFFDSEFETFVQNM